MSHLTETAYAKLNLALHVRGRRADGYHDIETVFAFCQDGDRLSVGTASDGRIALEVIGEFASGIGSHNLVTVAAESLRAAAGIGDGAAVTLDKRLPVAAGIGGGSADAAATLRLLTRCWNLDPASAQQVAAKLGADVPACLLSRPCRGTGTGNELEAIELPDLAGKPALLVNPRVPLSTAKVFARWDGIDRGPLGDWRDGRNDLEAAAIVLVPAVANVLDWLRGQAGADFVRMSGSGATCFALLDSDAARDEAAAAVPEHWWHLATRLR